MAFTKQAKPTESFSKTARPRKGKVARFGLAKFGEARFGREDEWEQGKQSRPTEDFSKVARP